MTSPGCSTRRSCAAPTRTQRSSRSTPTPHGARPGVTAVFTGADLAALVNPFLGIAPLPSLYAPLHYPLAVDRVRMVGDPVAMVVAIRAARRGRRGRAGPGRLRGAHADRHDRGRARHPSPAIWPGARGNVLFETHDEYGEVDDVFRHALHVVSRRFVQHRHSNQPMETRGGVAEVDRAAGTLTYHAATQNPHMLKWSLGLLTGRQPIWRSLADLPAQGPRLRALGGPAAAFARETAAGAKAKPSTPPPPLLKPAAMRADRHARPFLREPAGSPTSSGPRSVSSPVTPPRCRACVRRTSAARSAPRRS